MSQQFNVAVLGASGAVGQAIIEILEERHFPVAALYPLASSHSAGETVRFAGKSREIQDVETFDWGQVQLAFFSADADVSAKWAPIAADHGCIVIDNTACFRYDDDIPLVVPDVNPAALADFRHRNIIANPNSVTIQMLVALKPLHDEVGIARINVATYQSVSGSGQEGVSELAGQTAQLLNGRPVEPSLYPQQIAFNVIPHIDSITDNGYTREELSMVWETQKILGDTSIAVNPTCVRVPVFYGHAQAVHVELHQPLDAEQVKDLLRHAPGVSLFDDADYPTPVRDATGKDDVLVGRVRQDISHPSGVNMWIVADNVRKGAATNSVQIAELLVQDYL
ncbi:aspartate-semialdehyde dehydrogenase [Aeromonas cavernicola]|uniref:Aspartate-semialdehyde dehydrogenase n=1 Tax=Aeromonas cavernicola TaxID=1006623 RepID=A0A2H9U887_9GAMM|nr:aspartate-semialdehyde dehydrogenase [Aeromonas cavernicola]PJG60189.1 aspartate-semialdehyde dehydrogenase [Aeromonas cavernicola]